MNAPLPELLDRKAIMVETGLTRAAAEAIMRQVPIVEFAGLRKVYVQRSDVHALIRGRSRRTRCRRRDPV